MSPPYSVAGEYALLDQHPFQTTSTDFSIWYYQFIGSRINLQAIFESFSEIPPTCFGRGYSLAARSAFNCSTSLMLVKHKPFTVRPL